MTDNWEGLSPPYSTVVVDPPWHYEQFVTEPSRGTWQNKTLPYRSMTVDEIAALPITDLASRHSRVFLWTTNRYLPSAFDILHAWGFRYRQTLVWHKLDANHIGGSVASPTIEFLLVAVRGNPARSGQWPTAMIEAARGREHSTKPPAFADIVERVSPPPYVELFARQPRLGWDAWGHGYESDPIKDPGRVTSRGPSTAAVTAAEGA